MSFKSEAANVRAGIASGSYKKKKDPFEGFFNELASGIRKRDEEKRQEERVKRQEARAEARRVKDKQDAEDKLERERESLANFYLNSNQQSPTAENRASVMNIIKGGKFTSFSDLDEHMKTYTTYNNTTKEDIDAQMEKVGLLQEGDGPFQAMKAEAESMSTSDGTIEFTGKKPDLYDVSELRENNWEGTYQQLVAKGDTKNAERVKTWAVGQNFFEIVPNYSTKELMSLELEGTGGLNEIKSITPTNDTEAQTHLDGIIAVKKMTVENSNIFNKPEELLTTPLSTLKLAQGLYPVGTARGDNISNAIASRQSLESADSMSEMSTKLDQPPEYYGNAIALMGKLDQDDPFYEQNLKTLQNLTTLQSLAVDKANRKELDTDKARSVKEQALQAFYMQNGYYKPDAKGVVKVPDIAAMATFETNWKTITDISDKPEAWFSDANLLKMPVEDLKVIIDTGILDGKAKALNTVTAMYNSRVGQKEDTKLSELLDPTGKTFNSTTEVDTFLASVGPDRLTPEAFEDFARVRAVLAAREGVIADEKDINVYQMALREHLELPENKGLNGQEFIDMVANWETTWKDSSAKTPTETFNTDFVSGKINEANTLLRSDNPEDVAKGKAFMDNELPDMISALTAVSGTALQQEAKKKFLLDAGVSEDVANALVSGTAQVTKDAITGEQTLTNFDSFGVSAPADLQVPVRKIGLDIQSLMQNGLTTTINGEEVTFTPQQLAESVEFMKNEKKAGGNLDVQEAFGSGAFLRWFGSEVGGVLGMAPFKELTEMQTHIEGLNNAAMRTISVAIAGSRDSVFNKDAINQTLPQPSTLLENKTEAKGKLVGTVNQLKQIIDAQNATFNGRTTPEAKSKAFIQLQALEPLYESYSRLLTAWEAGEKASPKVRSGLQLTDTVTTGSEPEAVEPVAGSSLTQTGTQDGIKVYSFGGN
jgi:hypothetical protein